MYKFLLILLGCPLAMFGTTYTVGSGMTYTTPNALYLANVIQANDTILIKNQVYIGISCLANWSKNNLVIRGINGRPHLNANGQNIGGKAIWITSGNNIKVENIEFSGCTVPDKNGAGIRAESNDLQIRNCYFHDNENGILTNNPYAGTVVIEYCEFGFNGYGDGFSHNVYIGHVQKLIFQYNYSHHAKIGHNLKSRANDNIILHNRIMDEASGNSSRLIDLSNGGFSLVMGNLLMQGPNAVNNNMVGYGLEGLTNTNHQLHFINNTLINKRSTCTFLQVAAGTGSCSVHNNIFGGIGTVLNGTATSMSNNTVETTITNLNLQDEPNYDYHLTSASPGINMALVMTPQNGYSLTPNTEYQHVCSFVPRILNNNLDIGSYEYKLPCATYLSSYIFLGSYNNQWDNAGNWDNGCIPPPLGYSGVIKINVNCVRK